MPRFGVDVHDIIITAVENEIANGRFDPVMRARFSAAPMPREP
jgi:hypothetical protein